MPSKTGLTPFLQSAWIFGRLKDFFSNFSGGRRREQVCLRLCTTLPLSGPVGTRGRLVQQMIDPRRRRSV